MRTSLAGLYAGVGLGAAAIDADLAGAQQLLQMTEAEARIMRLEPAVEPHARFAVLDLDLFDACHRGPLFVGPIASGDGAGEPKAGKQAKNRQDHAARCVKHGRRQRTALPKHGEIERKRGKRGEAAKMPVATKSRSSLDALKRRASSSMNTPIAKEPATLMAMVPQGKPAPTSLKLARSTI